MTAGLILTADLGLDDLAVLVFFAIDVTSYNARQESEKSLNDGGAIDDFEDYNRDEKDKFGSFHNDKSFRELWEPL